MPDLAPASRRAELEKRQAQDLSAALTGERLEPVDRPDADAYSHLPGKKPDFLFMDGKSQPHFVEVTRLLPSTLRKIHSFVQREICDPLVGTLEGTYVLYISMADLPGSKIPEPVTTAIRTAHRARIRECARSAKIRSRRPRRGAGSGRWQSDHPVAACQRSSTKARA
ncbi:MAG TPA: hypothetical protein VGU71_06605 [Candidatus Dormibacteraeota bacterium]|nr:hypothetical protein [Candidatus Dormibacteraeota bacterium]